MFGLFKAKPPLGSWEKAWTENRMSWFADQFGIDRLLNTPTLLPGHESIPEVNDVASAKQLLQFVKQWMQADVDAQLEVFSDVVSVDSIAKTPRSEDSIVINVHEEQFADQNVLVAILARQLSRGLLVKLGRAQASADWTFDLLPAFLGLGIFATNAPLGNTNSGQNEQHWWSARQRGYLPSRIFGYALALRSRARSDTDVSWASELRQDACAAFHDSAKYLEKTGDTVFFHDPTQQPRNRLAVETLWNEVKDGSPSRKISAMWELSQRESYDGRTNQRASDLLIDCLRGRDAEVRAVAASTLPNFDRSANAAHELTAALTDAEPEVRMSSAQALAHYAGVDDDTVVTDLITGLKDDVRSVVFSVAHSLTSYGKAAEAAEQPLLKRLRRSLVDCRDDDATMIMYAVDRLVDDTKATIDAFFDDSDAEYRLFAHEILEQVEAQQQLQSQS